ncbi:AraC family transcriptional regulator [marine bacterium AO1-C]|nr:AraC family transcriptional regulator [marine bacterium AO1-C]
MEQQSAYTLIDRQSGELAFKIFSFEDNSYFDHLQRHNYYSIMLMVKGEAPLSVDFANYTLIAPCILCLSPYQPYLLGKTAHLSGMVLNFHPDFFCTYQHQHEVASEGILFHNIYEPPFFAAENTQALVVLLHQMQQEIDKGGLGQHELLVSYIKVFLIHILRIKAAQNPVARQKSHENNKAIILQNLIDNIEKYYREKHSASEYAQLLNISANALAKLVKGHYGKTLTDLIAQRIMIEAKRELYLTSRSVKEIAYQLGYKDEYYFSRFFKKQAGIPPNLYRSTVGFAKQEQL